MPQKFIHSINFNHVMSFKYSFIHSAFQIITSSSLLLLSYGIVNGGDDDNNIHGCYGDRITRVQQ